MDINSRKDKGRVQFLDLIPKEEREINLELSLSPPGENSTVKHHHHHNNKTCPQKISRDNFNHFFNNPYDKNPVLKPPQLSNEVSNLVMKQPSQPCDSRGPLDMHREEKKSFSLSPAAHTGLKRIAPGTLVGWPPVRSFRKNVTSGSSSISPLSEMENMVPDEEQKRLETSVKNKLVKINMDGIPVGRKVDLKTHDGYVKLSIAVDQLFRGFLAARSNTSSGDGMKDKNEGDKAIVCSFDGSGEYTLVYEDNEGDKMLVGDVPWNTFVSTVKRLWVLKSSEIQTLKRKEKGISCNLRL